MTEATLVSEHRLSDGTRVRIRPVRPEDARTLQDGFAQLSEESRRRRFLGTKRQLSDEEVRILTHGDGRRQVTLGAVRLDDDGWECEGLGIAHYRCLPDHPEVAEPSVVVLDAVQGLGLGRLLSEHLIRVACANGVKTFRALLVDDHAWLRDRVHRSYPEAQLTRHGHHLGADIPLPALPPHQADESGERAREGEDGHFWNMLRWVAQGSVQPDRQSALRRAAGRIARRLRRRSAAASPRPR